MRAFILSALGCLFWLVPLAQAASVLSQFGFYQDSHGFNTDSLPLLGIPLMMICLTVALCHLARTRPLPGVVIVASSTIAFVAAYCWLAIWSKGGIAERLLLPTTYHRATEAHSEGRRHVLFVAAFVKVRTAHLGNARRRVPHPQRNAAGHGPARRWRP
jgi:uncharacterized membrane protein